MRPDLVKQMTYISGVLVMLTSLWWGSPANSPSAQSLMPAILGDSTVTLEVRDTTVFPGDSFFSVAVYLTSPDLAVAGILADGLSNHRPHRVSHFRLGLCRGQCTGTHDTQFCGAEQSPRRNHPTAFESQSHALLNLQIHY
jgi:hypothetical protein